ncbi:MAG: EAL domain-containing protein [Desulfovibrio sp.]|nr:EAL domain-containing protein [Desulfovibrio sp.]
MQNAKHRAMTEEELVQGFDEALQGNQIYAYYQPLINHCTGRMVGAEALMRWQHPVYGPQAPSDFVPVLEKHDLIYRADLHMFECICRFQRSRLAAQFSTVPISANMSRNDIFCHDYVEQIERLRNHYEVPVNFLRIEITESSAIGGMELMCRVISQLHSLGYVVAMDDFGSGYSSLNILKDLNVDIIKLDMNFLNGDVGGRGGIILSSVSQMAKWLGTPLIAEGVETLEQANYMKSIGCFYIQGHLYAHAMPEEAFREKLKKTEHEPILPAMKLINAINAGNFWNPDSMETLIFSNFVGAALLFSYEEGKMELLRVNEKYIHEIGMNMTEKDLLGTDPWQVFDEVNRKIYESTIRRAIATGEEETCETWRNLHSQCCGDDRICVRSHLRVIGSAQNQYLLYVMVQNVTAEKNRFMSLFDSEKRFKFASEQANVYAWEYTIATKQMRPCFRCMRDLGLPPVLENYPEPVIEMGLFPPDYADLYRDWHRQIAAGVKKLEGIIPLTVGRIPFYVRYTTEFDENGKPLKAYGSATLVTQNECLLLRKS